MLHFSDILGFSSILGTFSDQNGTPPAGRCPRHHRDRLRFGQLGCKDHPLRMKSAVDFGRQLGCMAHFELAGPKTADFCGFWPSRTIPLDLGGGFGYGALEIEENRQFWRFPWTPNANFWCSCW